MMIREMCFKLQLDKTVVIIAFRVWQPRMGFLRGCLTPPEFGEGFPGRPRQISGLPCTLHMSSGEGPVRSGRWVWATPQFIAALSQPNCLALQSGCNPGEMITATDWG